MSYSNLFDEGPLTKIDLRSEMGQMELNLTKNIYCV